jgi:glycosyltransferase involved in cell wall biosynthesis
MPHKNPAVAVVMSTYNGMPFVGKQIESVLGQEGVAVSLFVRDDGSTDGTAELLQGLEDEGKLTLFGGKNLGVVKSFINLLGRVPAEFEWVALCDQDDVWHADKLSRAVAALSQGGRSVPKLYCSEYTFCDEHMNQIGRSHLNHIGINFATLLYETKVSGNTCVMNRRLCDIAADAGAKDVYGHDWWLGLIAAGLGELYFDDYQSLEYRRLSTSVSPTGGSFFNVMRFRVRAYLRGNQLDQIDGQLKRFYELFGEKLDSENKALIEKFIFGGRIAKAIAPVRLRQAVAEEIALRLLFLIGKL